MKMSDFPGFFNENFTQIHCFLIAMYSFLWFYSVVEVERSGLGVSLDYCFSDPSASFFLPVSLVASIFLSFLPSNSLFFMTISLTKSSCLLNESWAASSSARSFFYFSFFFHPISSKKVPGESSTTTKTLNETPCLVLRSKKKKCKWCSTPISN